MRHPSKKQQQEVKKIIRRGKRFAKPRVSVLAPAALDAHRLVDRAISEGRGYLYVDAKGRVRDVRHDADVSALPPPSPPGSALIESGDTMPSTALSALHADIMRTRDYLNRCIELLRKS